MSSFLKVAAAVVVGLGAIVVGLVQAIRERAPATPTGLVVITLDTTRADRLSTYGFQNVSLPHLERLAREGVVFNEATSVAPLTLPAHTSLFTGLLPPHHGVRDNVDPPLPDDQTTLAEVLQARGFKTGAFVGSVVLDPDRGLRQGFDTYSGVGPPTDKKGPRRQRPADAVVESALPWIETLGEAPFFLWVHLYDAHRPYDPPEPYASRYAHNPYVGEIAFADAQIGRLLDALDRRRLLRRSVVVLAGDHGESLGERGERDHGVFIYENVLRVPLMIRAPRLRPSRIGDVVRLTDVMPTVLDLLAVPAPTGDGVDLGPVMRGEAQGPDLEAYAESIYPERLGWSALRALRVGRFKYIEAPRPELYDLKWDPFEETNVFEARQGTAAAMAARLAAIAAANGSTAAESVQAVDAGVRERLAGLGYVTGTRSRPGPNQKLPDPKDVIHTLPVR